MKRILIYSHDTYGLGNIRRTLAIAEHMLAAHDDISILIVSGSPMLHAFRMVPRLDYVKLPCLTRLPNGEYGVKSLGGSYESVIGMRSQLLATTVAHYEPDLIVVDKKPFGVDDELVAALQTARMSRRRPRMVLLLRDILDSPKKTAEIWRRKRYYEAVEEHYDAVLVLGSESVFDVATSYQFPTGCAERLEYCGYLRRPPGHQTREDIRNSLGIHADDQMVLVTPGGGEDGAALARCYLQGLDGSHSLLMRTVLVTGPEMSRSEHRELTRTCERRSDVTLIEFTEDMMSYIAASDVVVSMAGYNTVCEFLSADRRAVVVPRAEPVREQLIRARLLARTGRIAMEHPDHMTPRSLIAKVHGELRVASMTQASDTTMVDMGGLDRVEKHLSVLLNDV